MTLVAIVGGSGSGKTWLAAALQQRLGAQAALLSADHFYRDRSHLSLAGRKRVNYDHPRSLDWRLLEEILSGCAARVPMQVPSYDFTTHSRKATWQRWRPKPVVLVEGLWLLRKPSLRRRFTLRIFVACPPKLRLKRRLQRDAAARGRAAAEVRDQFHRHVMPMGERYVSPQERWADVVLRSPVRARALDKLVDRIRRQTATTSLPKAGDGSRPRSSLPRS